MEKITAPMIRGRKGGEKITMLTAYDFPFAQIMDAAGIDIILVGDSVGNTVLGYPNTLPVTVDEMIHHTKAVTRGAKRALVVIDMPFMSYQESIEQARRNAGRMIKESGAEAVKVEGGRKMARRDQGDRRHRYPGDGPHRSHAPVGKRHGRLQGPGQGVLGGDAHRGCKGRRRGRRFFGGPRGHSEETRRRRSRRCFPSRQSA